MRLACGGHVSGGRLPGSRVGVLLFALLVQGCGDDAAPAFTNTEDAPAVRAQDSAEVVGLQRLGRDVWTALVAGDTAALAQRRLTETVHNERIWPELPAGRSSSNYPVEYAWRNIRMRDRAALERIVPRYAGSTLQFSRVVCEGLERFRSFRVHTDCRVRLQDANGGTRSLELFRHVAEVDGVFRVFRYYDPQD